MHLFEFEDQTWFPKLFRDFTTDFLRYAAQNQKQELHEKIASILNSGLKKSGTDYLVDMASGGGGMLVSLNTLLLKKHPSLKILLTDFYPNLEAFKMSRRSALNLDFIGRPIDAREVPPSLKGLRTQFLSFHHFKPKDAQRILQNAVDSQSGIFIFEDQDRSWSGILCELYAPVKLLKSVPYIKPFKFSRLIFTYLIPIVPITLLWDGLVSCLRTYSLKELKSLISKVDPGETYEWEMGRFKYGARPVVYLLGTFPKERYQTVDDR
ncbi:hypothetical protein FRZ59_12255 [Anseongella ginsenosidimutans]|nr:hypothetical protein [Anseongella ginsenosidimutans]QEC54271.1 hypothetical protein FRZ59_12255 [Anseongella ginsenosidimutans]